MTHLVYPGALHTRFEHSIGVRYIAGRLSQSLGLSDEEREVVEVGLVVARCRSRRVQPRL